MAWKSLAQPTLDKESGAACEAAISHGQSRAVGVLVFGEPSVEEEQAGRAPSARTPAKSTLGSRGMGRFSSLNFIKLSR